MLRRGGPAGADGEQGVLWVRTPSQAAGLLASASTTRAGPSWASGSARATSIAARRTAATTTAAARTISSRWPGSGWPRPTIESVLLRHPGVLDGGVVGAEEAGGLIKPFVFVVPRDPAAEPEELRAERAAVPGGRAAPPPAAAGDPRRARAAAHRDRASSSASACASWSAMRSLMVASTLTVKVRWSEADPAGIVFYPRFFEWFDLGTEALFESLGMPWRGALSRGAHRGGAHRGDGRALRLSGTLRRQVRIADHRERGAREDVPGRARGVRRRAGAAPPASRCAPGWRSPRAPAARSRRAPSRRGSPLASRESQIHEAKHRAEATPMSPLAAAFLTVHTPRYCTLEAAIEGKLASEVFRPVRDGLVAQGDVVARAQARRDRHQLVPPDHHVSHRGGRHPAAPGRAHRAGGARDHPRRGLRLPGRLRPGRAPSSPAGKAAGLQCVLANDVHYPLDYGTLMPMVCYLDRAQRTPIVPVSVCLSADLDEAHAGAGTWPGWRRRATSGWASWPAAASPTSWCAGRRRRPCRATRSSTTASPGSWPMASTRSSGPGCPSSRRTTEAEMGGRHLAMLLGAVMESGHRFVPGRPRLRPVLGQRQLRDLPAGTGL